uniref:Uncharacterized protein n=1 Tax=Solanum tuberosum TaxID=4113 RepID=M1BIN5_SOLTU
MGQGTAGIDIFPAAQSRFRRRGWGITWSGDGTMGEELEALVFGEEEEAWVADGETFSLGKKNVNSGQKQSRAVESILGKVKSLGYFWTI